MAGHLLNYQDLKAFCERQHFRLLHDERIHELPFMKGRPCTQV